MCRMWLFFDRRVKKQTMYTRRKYFSPVLYSTQWVGPSGPSNVRVGVRVRVQVRLQRAPYQVDRPSNFQKPFPQAFVATQVTSSEVQVPPDVATQVTSSEVQVPPDVATQVTPPEVQVPPDVATQVTPPEVQVVPDVATQVTPQMPPEVR